MWTNCYVVQGETEAEAKEFARYYDEKGDWGSGPHTGRDVGYEFSVSAGDHHEMTRHFIGGWAGFPIIGSRSRSWTPPLALSNAGLDGVLLTWARYEEQMRGFRGGPCPLVRQAGLR